MKAPLLKPGLLIQNVDDEMIILDPQSDAYFGLNEVGLCIFEQIEKHASIEEIVVFLSESFDVEEKTARLDLRDFLNELKEAGLLVNA